MGCFFSCFRVRDDPRPQINPVFQPISAVTIVWFRNQGFQTNLIVFNSWFLFSFFQEPLDSLASNNLWSVLVPEAEDVDQLQGKNGGYGATGSPVSDDGLRAEAKFLKACGTLPQTPDEIRNSKKFTDSQPQSGNMEATFHSWLPNTTTEKPLEKQPDQVHLPIKLFEEWENESDSSQHSPNSFKTGKCTNSNCTTSSEGCMVIDPVKETQTLNTSISYTPMVASTLCKTKSVRFEGESDTSSSSSKSKLEKINDQNLKKPSGTPCDQSVKPSPYPTPLKLTNDMQTPGTVFPSSVYNKESGKNPRIRLQYVHSGVDPEIFSLLEPPIEEMLNSDKLEECFEHDDKETPQSQIHWNNNNGDKISWWDGNGIPNTTNKYKEDQKVSWHATPFEERLEKALSDDKFITERKQIGQTSAILF
ncbi:hypothetical protein L2E82_08012 [Cichorium intybus]|uniref:Uncharacterized protein n=1 Tax=Cichorium intybus TaxID=13427 RepID=A0ACB9G6H5_CICIN|nr:hypothetical protein L2E82_08012 [Cichorium intybus]